MQWLEASLLLASSVHVGVVVYETDVLLRHDGVVNWWCSCLSLSLVILYIVELVLRLRTHAKAQPANWFVAMLDAAIIVTDAGNEVAALAVGRMPSRLLFMFLRIMRLVRPLHALALAPTLCSFVYRLSRAAEAAAWGLLFLVTLLSIWSLIAVEVLHPLNLAIAESGTYSDCEWCAKSFQSLAEANLTLLRHIVMGDDWGDVLVVMIERHPWTCMVFLLALASINLGLLSLVVATMAVRAQEASLGTGSLCSGEKVDAEIGNDEATTQFVLRICDDLDRENSGITIEKVVAGYESSEELRAFLRQLGVFRDDLQCMFTILDDEGAGIVTHEEFAKQLVRMKVRSSDSLLMFIKLLSAKSQQKVEEQLIWFEQRRHDVGAPKNSLREKESSFKHGSSLNLDTDKSEPGKRPVMRTVTPFASQELGSLATGSSPGTPMAKRNEMTLSFGEVIEKLKDFGEAPEEKMTSDAYTGNPARNLPVDPMLGTAIVSELDSLRRHIDTQLVAISKEFARGGLDASRGSDDGAVNCVGDAVASSRDSSRNRLPMPLPDLAVTPPPLEPSRRQGRRSGSPRNRGVKQILPLPPSIEEEEPKSDSASYWRFGFQEATGISCCQAKRVTPQSLVTVGPA